MENDPQDRYQKILKESEQQLNQAVQEANPGFAEKTETSDEAAQRVQDEVYPRDVDY